MGERMERRIARQFERLDADESGACPQKNSRPGVRRAVALIPQGSLSAWMPMTTVFWMPKSSPSPERMEERRGGKGEGKGRKGGQRD